MSSLVFAFDIETMPDAGKVKCLPEPKYDKRLKDPTKIMIDKAEKKKDQLLKMSLNPFTGKIASAAFWSSKHHGCLLVGEGTQIDEGAVVRWSLDQISESARVVTFNGKAFDIPFLLIRAMVLGVQSTIVPTAFMKRYQSSRHYDLMEVLTFSNWNEAEKLEFYSKCLFDEGKEAFDYTEIPQMIKSEEGRDRLRVFNLRDAELTWRIYEKVKDYLGEPL